MVARLWIGNYVTPSFRVYITHREIGTSVGGQFGWGGTPLKMYQWGPKVSSIGSEIRCRVQEQKLA